VNFYGSANQTLVLENDIFWNNFVANTSAPPVSVEEQQIAANVTFPQSSTGDVPYVITFNNIIEALQQFTDGYSVANLDVDPQFINAAGGNFRLASYSPAIDAGRERLGSGVPLTDLDGDSRYSSVRIDLGPYEFQ